MSKHYLAPVTSPCNRPRFSSAGLMAAALLFALGNPGRLAAQVYVTGPYGQNGTWNLYEVRGLGPTAPRYSVGRGGLPISFSEAQDAAQDSVELVSGKSLSGHLVAIGSKAENDFLKTQTTFGRPWSGWLGLSDDETFGGGESASSPPNPAVDGLKGLGGPAGDGVGWKWTNGEPFVFADWLTSEPEGLAVDEDYTTLSTSGWRAWTSSHLSGVLIEYETQMLNDFSVPAPTPLPVPGPTGNVGAWGVREVYVPTGDAEVYDLNRALDRLFHPPANAVVRDYETPVLSYADGYPYPATNSDWLTGARRRFEVVNRGDVAPGTAERLQLVAHGTIRVPEGQGGEWEFAVNSDDGFELWIDGAKFTEPPPRTSPYGSLLWPNTSVLGQRLGHVQLTPGDHKVEVVYFQGPIASAFGLLARGPGEQQFALVGDAGLQVSGAIPAVPGGFAWKQVQRPDATPLENLAEARGLIDAPGPQDQVIGDVAKSVNFNSPFANEGAWYFDNQRFPSFRTAGVFAFEAQGTLHVPEAGVFTFGFDAASGVELKIEGALLSQPSGAGTIGPDGQTIVAQPTQGAALTTVVATLAAGDYPLKVLTYKNAGTTAFLELFAAPGALDHFAPDGFKLLTDAPQTINLNRPAGLQLVPEPSTLALAMASFSAVACWWLESFRRAMAARSKNLRANCLTTITFVRTVAYRRTDATTDRPNRLLQYAQARWCSGQAQ